MSTYQDSYIENSGRRVSIKRDFALHYFVEINDMHMLPTQVYLQQQLGLAKLQGDVVSLLALPMENHTLTL